MEPTATPAETDGVCACAQGRRLEARPTPPQGVLKEEEGGLSAGERQNSLRGVSSMSPGAAVPAATQRPNCVVTGSPSTTTVPPPPPGPPARPFFRHVHYENLVAGLSGGVVSTLVLHPLDLVKIRFAVSDGLKVRPKYSGILHCLTTIWKQEGLRGLYQGVTPNVWGAGASWGLYFYFYNAIKAYKTEDKVESLGATEHLVSAAEAGAVTLCITNPIWVTKTRLVLQYEAGVDSSKRQYNGMIDALRKIYKYEGIRGLYKGFVPGLFGTSHGALQFMAYEELKSKYNTHRNRQSDFKLNTLEYIIMAALSKIFAVSATYPYQVVRARLQDQHNKYSGVMDVIRRTWSKKDFRVTASRWRRMANRWKYEVLFFAKKSVYGKGNDVTHEGYISH